METDAERLSERGRERESKSKQRDICTYILTHTRFYSETYIHMYDSVNLLLGLGICRVHVLCMQPTKTVFSGATFSSSLPIRTATQEMRDEDESCTLCAFHLITTDRFRGVKYCKILQAVCNITAVHQSNYRRLISIKKYWREGERERARRERGIKRAKGKRRKMQTILQHA